ncbi:MAG: sugar ABC transporter permease, partial [Paracoccaceae bacterium]|nr:sugar ABC transporter permease [Paracoccaceae bacterium]
GGETESVATVGPKRRKWRNSRTVFGLAMVAPALTVLVFVLLYPAFVALQSSFYRIVTVTRKETFVGLHNYATLLSDPNFWESFERSLIWSIGAISTQVIAGIAVALVLHKSIGGRSFVRGLVLFPYLVPAIVAVLIWRWVFSDTVGVANWFLVDFLGVIEQPVPWFDPGWVMVSIIIMSLWKYLPYWALFVLARLQTLPPDLIDAAKIDGANAWQRFRHITLPWIMPVVIVLLVLRSIWAFNEFDMVYLPAGGGPLFETTTIPVYIRRIAFEFGDIGHAAAVAVVMLILVALLTNFYFWVYRRAERRLG